MKKNSNWFRAALVLLAGIVLMTGCVQRERAAYQAPASEVGAEAVVDQAPPLPEVETMTIAPGPGFVWIPGAWSWRSEWVWDHGHWAHPPRAGAVWVSPRYELRDGKHVFIRGGWKY